MGSNELDDPSSRREIAQPVSIMKRLFYPDYFQISMYSKNFSCSESFTLTRSSPGEKPLSAKQIASDWKFQFVLFNSFR
jgi:hypothetical protein